MCSLYQVPVLSDLQFNKVKKKAQKVISSARFNGDILTCHVGINSDIYTKVYTFEPTATKKRFIWHSFLTVSTLFSTLTKLTPYRTHNLLSSHQICQSSVNGNKKLRTFLKKIQESSK